MAGRYASRKGAGARRGPAAWFALVLACVLLAFASFALCPHAARADVSAPRLEEAKSAVVIDQAGNVLYAKRPEAELPMASITKVMTAVVALDAGMDIGRTVTLVAPGPDVEPQMVDYLPGEQVTFGELLQVMLVWSANDAAYNIAVLTAGSEEAFVDLMNAKAAELGMGHSHFCNPHGLEKEGHYSCALDLARLARYALQKYPFIAQAVMMSEVTTTTHGQAITLRATDWLLSEYVGARGVKTGYIADNYTFMGASGRGRLQLYTAVMGCTTAMGRFTETTALMDWAYATHEDRTLARSEWVTHLQPYAFDLGLRVAVHPDDLVGAAWPDGGPMRYDSMLARPGRLLEAGDTYGRTIWEQDGRYVGSSFSQTTGAPRRASAWPPFLAPLFWDDVPVAAAPGTGGA